MSGKKENVQSSGITRRDFVKGLAIGAAGLGIATILPGGIITAASAADTTTKQQVGKQGDGIYIDGVAENMKSKTYTLEFVQPIKLVAVKDGKVQSEAPGAPPISTWSLWTRTEPPSCGTAWAATMWRSPGHWGAPPMP